MKQATHAAERETFRPNLPHWVMDGSVAETPENAGFASGSALALLHVALHDPNINVPIELLRNRLALSAAVQSLKLERRNETEKSILDAYLLTKPGDHWGPAGDMYDFWKRACSIRINTQGWQNRVIKIIPEHMQDDVYGWLDFSWQGETPTSPVAAAAKLLHKCYATYSRNEVVAFFLADLRLSHDLRWDYVFPFMAQHITANELRSSPDEFLIDCHRATATAAQNALRLAYDLARRAAHLRTATPKLRAKSSYQAVQLFLTEVAVSPSSMLSPNIKGTNVPMTGRSARRLCDRLVELGVARELTGRSTYRFYGV